VVVPVVDGHQCQCDVEGAVAEREGFGHGSDHGSAPGATLGDHDRRGLDRDHGAVRRLVGAASGADVDDGVGRAERFGDLACPPRVARRWDEYCVPMVS